MVSRICPSCNELTITSGAALCGNCSADGAPLTYARVGGPPDDWQGLRVFNLKTGEEMKEVVEVHAREGWLRRYKTKPNGEPVFDPATQSFVIERIRGRFEIKRLDNSAP